MHLLQLPTAIGLHVPRDILAWCDAAIRMLFPPLGSLVHILFRRAAKIRIPGVFIQVPVPYSTVLYISARQSADATRLRRGCLLPIVPITFALHQSVHVICQPTCSHLVGLGQFPGAPTLARLLRPRAGMCRTATLSHPPPVCLCRTREGRHFPSVWQIRGEMHYCRQSCLRMELE